LKRLKSTVSLSVILVLVSLVSGCKGHFNAHVALDAIRTKYDLAHRALEIGHGFPVGDVRCDANSQDLTDAHIAEKAGWVQVDEKSAWDGKCWSVQLTPVGKHAVSPDCAQLETFECAVLAKSTDVKVGEYKRDGSHATADIELYYAFTPQMKTLAAENSFPDLRDIAPWRDCRYDLPNAQIVCKGKMQFALMNGSTWVVDVSNPD